MKKISWSLAALMLMAAPVMTSCSDDLDEVAPAEEVKSNIVTITIAPPVAEAETRLAINSSLQITGWTVNDEVTLYKYEIGEDEDEYIICSVSDPITFTCSDPENGKFSGILPDGEGLDDYKLAVFGAKAKVDEIEGDEILHLDPATLCSTDLKDVVIMAAWKDSEGNYSMKVVNNVLKIKSSASEDVVVAWNSEYADNFYFAPHIFWFEELSSWEGYSIDYMPSHTQYWSNENSFTLKAGVVSYVSMGICDDEGEEWGLVEEDGTIFLERKSMVGRKNTIGKLYNAGTVTGPIKAGTAKRTGDIDVNWVQLWPNGPKFAEYNVGVTDAKPESYGGYYCWGGSQNAGLSYANDANTGTADLSGDSDTATKLWGSNWRMPTDDELGDLDDKCDVTWTTVNGVNGRKFTGRGGYSSNSIFLPAAGGYEETNDLSKAGIQGYYWTSTPDDYYDNLSCNWFFNSSQLDACYSLRSFGYSVRAVLK